MPTVSMTQSEVDEVIAQWRRSIASMPEPKLMAGSIGFFLKVLDSVLGQRDGAVAELARLKNSLRGAVIVHAELESVTRERDDARAELGRLNQLRPPDADAHADTAKETT